MDGGRHLVLLTAFSVNMSMCAIIIGRYVLLLKGENFIS